MILIVAKLIIIKIYDKVSCLNLSRKMLFEKLLNKLLLKEIAFVLLDL